MRHHGSEQHAPCSAGRRARMWWNGSGGRVAGRKHDTISGLYASKFRQKVGTDESLESYLEFLSRGGKHGFYLVPGGK